MTRACAQDIWIEDYKLNILGKHQSGRSHSGLDKLGNRPQLIYFDNIIWGLVKLYVGLIGSWKIQNYSGL